MDFEEELKSMVVTKEHLQKADERINQKAREMLARFVDELGIDGKYYVQSGCKAPVVYGSLSLGMFITPGSEEMDNFFGKNEIDDDIMDLAEETGLIVINKEFDGVEDDEEVYKTIIHEYIHSNRNVLLYDAFRKGVNPKAYIVKNGRVKQDVSELSFANADPSQDVIKGSIDTSKESFDDKKDFDPSKYKFKKIDLTQKMKNQYKIDETLVEIMAGLAVKLDDCKRSDKQFDIWYEIEELSYEYEGKDIGAMCDIILKHNDLELFNWMIDPITYSGEDIHYDFFSEYTKDDTEMVEYFFSTKDMDLSAFLPKEILEADRLKDIEEEQKKKGEGGFEI